MNRFLTPLLVIAVSLGIYFLYIDTAYTAIGQRLASEKVIDGFLVDAQNARAKLDTIAAEYNAFPPDADERLKVFLPDTVDPVRLIVDMSAVAERHGLTLSAPRVSIGVADPDKPATYLKHSIKFKVISTYPVFHDFLRDIQSSLALRDFGMVTFDAPKDTFTDSPIKTVVNPAFAVYDYDVELTTYSLRK